METSPESRLGAGVEKSIRSCSVARAGDFGFPVLRLLHSSSKDGMTFGGVKGMTGFRIDFGRTWAICKHVSQGNASGRAQMGINTFMALADVSVSASRPPGPRLLPLDFFFAAACPSCARCRAAMSVVAFAGT